VIIDYEPAESLTSPGTGTAEWLECFELVNLRVVLGLQGLRLEEPES